VEAPASPRNVSISLRVEPPQAELFVDDGPALSSPQDLSVVPDGRVHRVRARLSGFEDREETLTFEQNQSLVLVLKPSSHRATASNRRAATRSATPAQITTPAPDATTSPANPGRKLGELPTVIKKPPRTLDSENPFAENQ